MFQVNDSLQLHGVMLPAIVKRIENGTIALAFEMLEKGAEQIIQQEIINLSDKYN
jgi:hypothetical protein